MRYYLNDEQTRPLMIAIVVLSIILVLYLLWFIFIDLSTIHSCELYAKSGTVTKVNEFNNTVSFVDSMGEEWIFEDCEDWEIGDHVACIMSNNATEIIYDDIIINVRYEGT